MKVGDVVCLKSGGQRMTVERLTKTAADKHAVQIAMVTWMHNASVYRDQFPEASLMLLEDGDLVRPLSPKEEYERSRPVATSMPGGNK